MDLQLTGKKAIVCAASKGLGKACAMSLAREGASLVINARTQETLEATAADIRQETGAQVTAIACDITTAEGRAAVLDACPEPDILVNNAGGPPPGDFREWEESDWQQAVNNNMITPIMLIKATVDGMCERGFGRIINITSAAVKQPIPTLGLSNGARGGLTGFIAGLSRDVAKHGVTINNMLPGPYDTDRLKAGNRFVAEKLGRNFEEFNAERAAANPTGRFGIPWEFGEVCAFLCSPQAAYFVGQNFVLDGGDIRVTM